MSSDVSSVVLAFPLVPTSYAYSPVSSHFYFYLSVHAPQTFRTPITTFKSLQQA